MYNSYKEFLDFIDGIEPYSCTMRCKKFNYHGRNVANSHKANPPYEYWCICGRRPEKDGERC